MNHQYAMSTFVLCAILDLGAFDGLRGRSYLYDSAAKISFNVDKPTDAMLDGN